MIGAAGGGVAEIIIDGETGLLFRPNDSNDLARCLERMIRDHNLSGRWPPRAEFELIGITASRQRPNELPMFMMKCFTTAIVARLPSIGKRNVHRHSEPRQATIVFCI